VSSSLLKGRPFGGTTFLWNSSLNNNTKVLDASPDIRCLAISITLNEKVVVMFNVYLPCLDSSPSYDAELDEYIGFIEYVLDSNTQMLSCLMI